MSHHDADLPAYNEEDRDEALALMTTEKLLDDDEINLDEYDSSRKTNLTSEHGMDMKRTVLKWFAALGCGIMCVLFGSYTGTVVGTNVTMVTDMKAELNDQVDRQAYSTLDEAGQYLTRVLEQYDQSVISYTAFMINTALKTGPEFDQVYNVSNYWDDERGVSALCQPTAAEPPRFPSETVSLCGSSAFITSTDTANIGTLTSPMSPTVLDVINKTTVLDPFLRSMWETNEDCYIIYAGFDTTPPFIRRYPGRATQALYDSDAYNPTGRPWYTEAIDYEGETIYTAPYQDYHTNDWMITGARTFYNYTQMAGTYTSSTGEDDPANPTPYFKTLGVVGVDILIESVSDTLNSISFLSSGKLSLLRSDGQVIADQDWDIATATDAFYYSDLTTPTVSASLWSEIVAVGEGESKNIVYDKDERQVYVKHLSVYNGQFYLVVFITTEEIYVPVEAAIAELVSINTSVLVALAIGLSAMLCAIMGFMYFLLQSIMKTFHDIEANVETLLRNVGQSDRKLGDNMVEVDSGASVELTQLSQGMNRMVNELQSNRGGPKSVAASGTDGEALSLNELWGMVDMTHSIDPSAPPMTNAYQVRK
jgi:hypothetical protein